MTVYVIRDGKLVERISQQQKFAKSTTIGSPMVSRFESIESPVTGQTVSSWRERDRDMNAAGAVDPRDIPRAAFEKRKEVVKRNARSKPDS